MNNNPTRKWLKLLACGVALAAASGGASAEVWTFHGDSVVTSANGGFGAATGVVNTGSVGGTATAWANTGDTNLLAKAYLTDQNGFGMGVKNNDCGTLNGCTQNGDSGEGSPPEHAIDNNDRNDSILFTFTGDKVNLNAVTFGWVSQDTGYKDSDFSVYAYTGLGVGNLTGLTFTDAAMELAGWKLIDHFSGDDKGSTQETWNANAGKTTITNSTYSSYWLISASNDTYDGKKDAFKLLKVAGTAYCDKYDCSPVPPSGNPEPGTLLLMGAGLFGLSRFSARRPIRCAA